MLYHFMSFYTMFIKFILSQLSMMMSRVKSAEVPWSPWTGLLSGLGRLLCRLLHRGAGLADAFLGLLLPCGAHG